MIIGIDMTIRAKLIFCRPHLTEGSWQADILIEQ